MSQSSMVREQFRQLKAEIKIFRDITLLLDKWDIVGQIQSELAKARKIDLKAKMGWNQLQLTYFEHMINRVWALLQQREVTIEVLKHTKSKIQVINLNRSSTGQILKTDF